MKWTNEGFPIRSSLDGIQAKYRLVCSICGLETTLISIKDGNLLIISSPLRRFGIRIPVEQLQAIEKAISEKELAGLHNLIHNYKESDFDGLDFYCPECNKIYCEIHYQLTPFWDLDFYDYTNGKCPKGHERCMDD